MARVWEPQVKNRWAGLLVKILNTKFPGKSEDEFEKWEADIKKYEEDAKSLAKDIAELNKSPATPKFGASPAAVVAMARERARIFLLSELQADQVEDLGMAFVESPGEIKNLLRGHQTCTLLPNAHQVSVIEPLRER